MAILVLMPLIAIFNMINAVQLHPLPIAEKSICFVTDSLAIWDIG
jgi:hypothetical protein